MNVSERILEGKVALVTGASNGIGLASATELARELPMTRQAVVKHLGALAEAGLVEGEPQATGGRKRTVYRLTTAGRMELRRWLTEPAETFEVRDEGLLKLFFAIDAAPGRAAEILDEKQRLHEQKIARLREVEPKAAAAAASGDPFPYMVLRYGIESSESTIAWCDRARAELDSESARSA
jgi:DNA-binding PadR family transcriptional regulator